MFTSIVIGGKEYVLRYTYGTRQSIKNTAFDFLKDLWSEIARAQNSQVITQMKAEGKSEEEISASIAPRKRPIDIYELSNYLAYEEVQMYLFWQGLVSLNRELTYDQACELYDLYMSEQEADGGERYEAFLGILGDAILSTRGASRKKLEEKPKAAKEAEEKNRKETLMDLVDARIELKAPEILKKIQTSPPAALPSES